VECLDGGAQLADLLPGVTVHGHDIGRWLQHQRQPTIWHSLTAQQHEHLTRLGVEPSPTPKDSEEEEKTPSKASRGTSGAFERGLAPPRQYKKREGHLVPAGTSRSWRTARSR
jgi:hypothetical protein